MTPSCFADRKAWFRAGRAAGVVVAVIGFAVLLGSSPAAALCFLGAGASLFLFGSRVRFGRRLGLGGAALTSLVPVVVRMPPVTAATFVCLGVALARLHFTRGSTRLSRVLAAVAGVIAFASLVGSPSGGDAPMAVPTALAFLVATAGTLAVQADRGLLGIVTSDTTTAVFVRRLLAPAILLPIFLGGLRLLGERAGLYDTQLGTTLYAVANVLTFAALVTWTAHRLQLDELSRAKEGAEAALRVRTDFLARMSHELRTPMNGVLGMTRLALQGNPDGETRDALESVHGSATELLSLINDVLDFSKIDAGRLRLEATPFGLRDCLARALRAVAPRAHQKRLELTLRVAPEVPEVVVGDARRLRQVLFNLVANAVEFTDVGEVVVSAKEIGRYGDRARIRFEVRDTGIGIAPERQRTIFEAAGNGLGLPICAELVELMGGAIGVSGAPGAGSTFWFSLDLPVGPARRRRIDGVPEALRGLRVLVVDDHDTGRDLVAEAIDGWGLRPRAVPAAQALSAAAEEVWGLLVVDEQSADCVGDWFIEALRRAAGTAPLVLLCRGDGERGDARVAKPIEASELLETILAVLARRSEAAAPRPRRARRLQVLVADDHPVNRKLASRLLEKLGHAVTTVATGRGALTALARDRFDLVLMDVQMPDMDGLETTRFIRAMEAQRGGHVPIFALTAQALEGDRERCLAAGMDGYLAKPLHLGELLAATEPLAEVPPFHPEELLARAGGDRALFDEVVAMFLADAPDMVAEVRSAWRRSDAAALTASAHRLKGALLSLAAPPAAGAAARVEQIGRQGGRCATGDIAALEEEVARLRSALERAA